MYAFGNRKVHLIDAFGILCSVVVQDIKCLSTTSCDTLFLSCYVIHAIFYEVPIYQRY